MPQSSDTRAVLSAFARVTSGPPHVGVLAIRGRIDGDEPYVVEAMHAADVPDVPVGVGTRWAVEPVTGEILRGQHPRPATHVCPERAKCYTYAAAKGATLRELIRC